MIRVGISGWRYPPWRGVFYPEGLPQRRELEYAASRLGTIEINGSFYSLQRPEYYRGWAEQVPADFLFAVKGPRFITHLKKLADPEVTLANFFASGVLGLGARCGPVLWQLPPTMRFDPALVEAFCAALPHSTTEAARLAGGHDHRLEGRALTETDADRPLRHAVEARHPSFADPAFTRLLGAHGIATVVADTAGKYPQLTAVTSDLVYVRLHGDAELYVSGYDEQTLDTWAERVRGWAEQADVLVYFDNDVKVRAPVDAIALAERLGVSPEAAPGPLPGR